MPTLDPYGLVSVVFTLYTYFFTKTSIKFDVIELTFNTTYAKM